MKTNEFLLLLKENPQKQLFFEYSPGKHVAPGYHITEIKNIIIDSVDCGAGTDFWKETIIQLWENPTENSDGFMSSKKALGILEKVDRIKPMEREVEVKFEYSNPNFHTAQLFVNDHSIENNSLILHLGIEKTDCKAKETCGITEAVASEPASQCAPGSGCC